MRRYLSILSISVCVMGAAAPVVAIEWQSTWENTWGYTMMSPKERSYFESEIRNVKTMQECAEVLKHHNIVIQQRIDDWGVTPRRAQPVDTCGALHAQGLLAE